MIVVDTRALLRNATTGLFALLLGAAAEAQGGYVTEKHPELGMTFSRARDYEAIPLQPSEEWDVLYYAEKEAYRERDRKRFRPELRFAWIDHDPEPTVPATPPPVQASDDGKGGEPEEPPKPIDSLESYFEQVFGHWELGRPMPLRERSGNQAFEYEFELKDRSSPVTGRVFSYSDDERTIAVYGFCAEEDADEQFKIWRTMLKKIKFYEREEEDTSKLERYYERRKFKNPAYRIQVRSQLVRGWEADDTENFILVYSTKDEPLIRIMKSELEAIREEYVKLFPPAGEVEAVSTVRICKDEDEYRKYGGPRGTGGYWSAGTEELVFYDYENVDGEKGSGKANTRVVLYHEAFHQYIYYAIGEVAPHSWFNEGTGDFFSGAVIKGGKVKKIGVNPWRIELVQAGLLGHPRFKPLAFSEILNYTQEQFYGANRGMCYAQAWSMIYFLRTAKEVQQHPVWSSILDVYFDTLQNEYARQIWGRNVADMEEQELEAAKLAAREAAVKKAFSDVDLLELERAWREFTLDLKVPN